MAQLLFDFRNDRSERVYSDYINIVKDVEEYMKMMLKDNLLMEILSNDMEKKGIKNVREWRISMTGTFDQYKEGHK